MKKKCMVILVLMSVLISYADNFNTITNDSFWKDTSGGYIFSQGGGIFRFPDPKTGEQHYYWYGVKYKEAMLYAPDALAGSKSNMTNFVSVTCYQSDDLVNWKFVRDVMTGSTFSGHDPAWWFGRLGVAYVPEIKKFALLVQYDNSVGVFLSSTPTGDFTYHQQIDMTSLIGTPNTGDQTVFTDDDGQSYLCYSYGKGRGKVYISKIGVKDGKVGLVDVHQIYTGSGREGDCMFKYKGKYYVCASDLFGWNASNVYYMVSNSIYGPYTPTNNMQIMPGSADDYGHVTQTGFFYTLKGSQQETVIYCGDRWAGFAGNGNGFNQWCPLSFENEKPYFNSMSQWKLNAETGKWEVGPDNNYIKNSSFDADRMDVPSTKKPAQTYLKGWSFNVIQGNKIVQGSADSPMLNANNTTEDRSTVMGNKCMNITDNIDFKRKIWQEISSTHALPLKDGTYRLTAQVKSSSIWNVLYIYAKSKNQIVNTTISYSDGVWHKVKLDNIKVRGGKVEVGVYADGKSGASCHVDDLVLELCSPTDSAKRTVIDKNYWLGADISNANGMAVRGATLLDFEGDKKYELTELMHHMGLNAARYRVWVNPGRGWGQAADRDPHAGSCDTEDLLANCLLAKKYGMEIMISFHYSDTWADPKHQPIPRAWMNHSYEEMLQDVRNHTTEVLLLLKANGIEPKWVQVGNETRNGLLWNPAKLSPGEKEDLSDIKVAESMGHSKYNPDQYAGFIEAGCEATKSIFPHAITIVHLDNGYDSAMYDWNLGILEKNQVNYDMVGMSLYPYWAKKEGGRPDADGVIDDCVKNILHVYQRFGKESMIVETGYEDSKDSTIIEESYRQFSKAIHSTRDNTKGHCHGIFYWAPESRPGGYDLGAFGADGRPTKIMRGYVEAANFK